jgi:predicted TIM-barrel fold metal-dependent hydrolase
MGIAKGRFIVDTHVHPGRHAIKWKKRGIKPDFRSLVKEMGFSEAFDNSGRLLYDMDLYGLNMAVLQPAPMLGMGNDLNAKLVKEHPDRFIAMCSDFHTCQKALRGEQPWSVEAAVDEVDEALSTGRFKGGIGEGIPHDPNRHEFVSIDERFEEVCAFMNLARRHGVPVNFHAGVNVGYGGGGGWKRRSNPEWFDPLFVHDVASEYPDVPIIMAHGGMIGWWSEMFMDKTMEVVASHDEVYLETGRYWAGLYEKPLLDPNIGAEKMIWGTDWGASVPVYWQPGKEPENYLMQVKKQGVPGHQIDIMGWSLRQLDKLDITQDDLNLILGGNAVRIFKLEDQLPYTRLFKQYVK